MEMIWSVVRRGLSCWWEWVSRRRHAKREGAELAPGTNETLQMLSDFSRRPPEIREPLPMEVTNHVLEVPRSGRGPQWHDRGTLACAARKPISSSSLQSWPGQTSLRRCPKPMAEFVVSLQGV